MNGVDDTAHSLSNIAAKDEDLRDIYRDIYSGQYEHHPIRSSIGLAPYYRP
jgi:hypothetical protein